MAQGRSNRMVRALSDDEVRKTGVADIRKEYMKLSEYYMRIYERDLIYCPVCDDFHAQYAFYEDKRYPNGFYPECKESLKRQALDYDKKSDSFSDNKEKTIKVLQKLDLPFIETLYESAIVKTTESLGGNAPRSRTSAYQSYLTSIKSLPQYAGLTFEDSQMNDHDIYVAEEVREARPEIKKIFGDGFTESDYIYLQDKYDEWYARTQIDSLSQETYIVQLCFVQLNMWKAEKVGKDTKDLIKSFNDLMAGANLQPKQNVNNASGDSLTYGQQIEKLETTRPVSEPSDEFKDVDGIMKYISTWFLGHIAKAFGLKNVYSQMYEIESKKYTVEPPKADEEGESKEIRQRLFGKDGE